MADAISQAEDPAVHTDSEDELRREAFTMALYVAICLLAALSAVTDHTAESERNVFKLVWGTTVGLALACWPFTTRTMRYVPAGTAPAMPGTSSVCWFAAAVTTSKARMVRPSW